MTNINKRISASILSLLIFSATAATTLDNKDDGSALGTSDTPQIKEQMKSTDQAPTKSTTKKSHMNKDSKKMKMMDTNSDGMVSKEEYMSAQEKMYENMKPSDQGVKY